MKCWRGLSSLFLAASAAWLLIGGATAQQPGRNCLTLCPAGNLTCSVSCAQCNFNCCNATCIQSGSVCSPTCFPTTLNESACCVTPGASSTPATPPPWGYPYVEGPGDCSSINIPFSTLTLVAGSLFSFNITAVLCSLGDCEVCSENFGTFTGPSAYFRAAIVDNATNLSPSGASCNVSNSTAGIYSVVCLTQISYGDRASNYTLTVTALSYGDWISIGNQPLRIIPGPVSIPLCIATWDNGTSTIPAGTQAVLRIQQKDALNNTVCGRNGRPELFNFVYTSIFVSNVASIYNETFNVTYDIQQGTQTVSFYPRQLGMFYLQIGNGSNVIQKSPFRYDVVIGPASTTDSLTQWPSAVNTFEAGSTPAFGVFLVDLAGNIIGNFTVPLDVYFIDGNVHNPFPLNVTVQPSQAWSVSFVPTVAGQYLIHVGNGSNELSSSPLVFTVVSGPVVVANCTGLWVDGISIFKAGDQASLLIKQMDAYNNNVSMQTGSLDAFDFVASVTDQTDHSVMPDSLVVLKPPTVGSAYRQFNIFTQKAGNYQMIVGDTVDSIVGSPFTLAVLPGPMSVPKCVASWISGNVFDAGTTASFKILKTDLYGNNVFDDYTFQLTFVSYNGDDPSDGTLSFNISEQKMSQFLVPYAFLKFVPTVSGNISLTVGSSTESVTNSPLFFQVRTASLSLASCVSAWGDQSSTISAGSQARLDVILKDLYNNTLNTSVSFSVSILDSSNVTLTLSGFNLSVDSSITGYQTIRFYPVAVGQYSLKVEQGGVSVSSSPFYFSITAGPPSAVNCTAVWRGGINSFQAGSQSIIDILVMDRYNNSVSSATGRNETLVFYAQVLGYSNMVDWNLTMVPQNYSGYQTVSFYPRWIGSFLLRITGGNINIRGSPFSFTVAAGPVSISNSIGQWPSGIQYFPQNATIQLFIYPIDLYGNPVLTNADLEKNFTAAVYNSDLSTSVLSNLAIYSFSNISLLLSFSMATIGKYFLQVGNETEDVIGSPYTFYVATDTVDPLQSIVEGDGLTDSNAGTQTSILIQLRDSDGNPAAATTGDLTVQALLFSVAMNVGVNITAVPKTTGIFLATYTATIGGNYRLFVRWRSLIIGTGSPVSKTVMAGSVYAPYCNTTGSTGGGVAGILNFFQVAMFDSFNNSKAGGVVSINFSTGANAAFSITLTGTKFTVVYNITKATNYTMTVLAGERNATTNITGSPFKVVIQPGPLNFASCSGNFKSYISFCSVVQGPIFTINQRDQFNNPIILPQINATAYLFWATVYFSNGTVYPTPDMFFRLYSMTTDWYELRWGLSVLGTFYVDVYSKANPWIKIKGSPFNFTMVQEPPLGANCNFTGTALQNAIAGQTNTIYIRLFDQYKQPVVGNFQSTNSNYIVVNVSQVNSINFKTPDVLEDTINRGNYSCNYTMATPGFYTVRVTWLHPLWKSVFLGLFNVTVSTGPMMITRQCKPSDPGLTESLSAYSKFDSFNNRTFSYVMKLEPYINASLSASGTLTPNCTSHLYSAILHIEVVSTHWLHSRYFSLHALNSPVPLNEESGISAGVSSSFLDFLARWSNVSVSAHDEEGNPIMVATEVAGFTIQELESCATLAIVGQKYLSSSELDKYEVSMVQAGQLLTGSPFTIVIFKGLI